MEQTERQERVAKPYVPRLAYDDEIDYRPKKRVAGRCYRSEARILEMVEDAYDSKIKRRRRVIRTNRLLYQLMLRNGLTLEVAFLDVGIKGYHVRYCKVKKLRWRNKKLGHRVDHDFLQDNLLQKP